MSNSIVTKPPRRRKKMAERKKTLLLTSMVAPGAIWLLFLRYVPMLGISLAFKDVKLGKGGFITNIIQSEWVGFENFKFIFQKAKVEPGKTLTYADSGIRTAIKNTLGYNALWIVLGLVIAVTFAIILNEVTNKFAAKTYQTLMFFPYFLSWVVASYFVLAFLDPTKGLVSQMTKGPGGGVGLNFYKETPEIWPYILTVANIWKNTGYATVLYLAAITGIDGAQFEAAAIDGASKWKQIIHITLPNLRPMITILFILNVGKIFNADFGLFHNIPQNPGPLLPVTQVIDTFVYYAMNEIKNQGMSTAAGLFQNVVGFITIMTANTIVRRVDEDSSLF